MSNPTKPPGLHTIVQYTVVPATSDGGDNTIPRTETTKALLQPHMTVDTFLSTIDRLIASSYPGYVREEPSEVVYYPPMVANSHPSEEEAISIDRGTTICNVPAIAKRREITIAAASSSSSGGGDAVDEFDRPYIIASSSPICLVIRRRRGSLLLAQQSSSTSSSLPKSSSFQRKSEPRPQLPQDPTEAADLLIADELAMIQEGRQSSSPQRHWSRSLSKPTTSETVLEALSTEERILQTRLAAVQERAISIKSRKATLTAQKATLKGELQRARDGYEEAGGEENQRRKERLEEEVEGLRTEIAVQRQRESEMVTKAADEMAASPSPRRSGGNGVASPGSPYDPLFSPEVKKAAPAAAATTTGGGKYAVADLSDHEGYASPQQQKRQRDPYHPSSHVNHHPRHPPATHEHRTDDTPRHHHHGYSYDDHGVAEDFGDDEHLGSGPPPPLPPREGYATTSATTTSRNVPDQQQQQPSPTHYYPDTTSSPSGAVVGSRYRSEVDQERAGRFGGGGVSSRYQHSPSDHQAVQASTNYESHFDANAVDETSWLNPVLRRDVDSALSQVLPIPKYLQENHTSHMSSSSPPPPTPHVQMMNSPPNNNTHTSFPRVPTMTSGNTPGSLTTSLSAYLYQMEGGSPQGLRKDLITRLGSRQYNSTTNNSGGGGVDGSSSSSPSGGYQPPQHIASQRHLYGDRVHNTDYDDHHHSSSPHHAAAVHATTSSSPQFQQSKYFQHTSGNHHPSSSPYTAVPVTASHHQSGGGGGGSHISTTSTPGRVPGGGGHDDYEDQTPPQPQYRRPSYGALRGGGVGGGGAQSFGSGAMRLNSHTSQFNTNSLATNTTSAPSSYYPAAGRGVSNTGGRVVPNFDESP